MDGVLTDGTVWLDEDGRELKRVSFTDIMGVSIARRAGLRFALVSGESGPCLDQIASKFGIGDVFRGCTDKAAAVEEFASRYGLDLSEICYVGDDVNDLPAFAVCGLALTPRDAHPAARAEAAMVTSQPAGRGAVREVVEYLLRQTAP